MRTKAKNVFDISSQHEFDVIVLVESWLNADFYDAEFFDTTLYNVYRKDRNADRTGCSRGGGVLVAVKSHYKSSLCTIDDDGGLLDQLIISISGYSTVLLLCVSYIPPGSADVLFSKHLYNILFMDENMAENTSLCVMGDFNLKSVHWSKFGNNTFLSPSNVNQYHEIDCVDNLTSLNLIQINHIANKLNRFLDLVFVPHDCKFNVYECLLPISPSNLHHIPLVIEIDSFNFFKYSPSLNSYDFNFNLCDFDVLNSNFACIDWMTIFCSLPTSLCYEEFLKNILDICNDNIPIRKAKPYKLPWYTRGLKKLKNLRNKFHNRFVESGDSDCLAKFTYYQREFNCLNKFLYKQFLLEKENGIKNTPKLFWTFIKSKKKSSDIPSTVKYNGNISKSCGETVHMFADFFESNFESSSANVTGFLCSLSKVNVGYMVVSEEDVYSAIMLIKNGFKSDADGLCAHLLKKCASTFTFPLTYIFNMSLREGVFIDHWKSGSITPVFKSGEKDDVTSYRPISRLSCVSKVFEHIVYKKLFFITKSWISPHQHGFFSGRSTTTNLTIFSEFCISALEHGGQVEVIYTDFSKAFDKLSHGILLAKLRQFGLHSNFLAWIESYLSNRVCKVIIEGYESRPYVQSSGVPQGSILGPLLFNLFINDISSCFIKSKYLLYADDLKFFCRTDSLRDVVDLQNDLDHLIEWCSVNKLCLNLSKCFHMSYFKSLNPIQCSFNIGNYLLKTVKSTLDLGVMFDSSMSFVSHIDYIVPKAYKMLAFLKRNCSDFSDPNTLRIIYTAFVRSKLEYASVVWSPHCNIHISRIEKVQRTFIKFALRSFGLAEHTPYRSKCLLLGLQTLEYRRKFQSALLVFDLINNVIDCPDLLSLIPFHVPSRSLRYVDIFYVPRHRTNLALSSPLTRTFLHLNTINTVLQKELKPQIEFCSSKDNFKLFLVTVIK